MNMKAKVVGGIAASTVALGVAVSTIGGLEGKENSAYRDVIGVWTICYGETHGVKPGQYKTDAQCDAMFQAAIIGFERNLDKCLKPKSTLPIGFKIAVVSWAYNVGIGAACRSTLVRLANRGQFKAACDQLPRWNRAGGRVLRGLTNRRLTERELCLVSL